MHPIYWLVAAHFIGDYVLQTEYIAREKCKNWYVMSVHCFLYSAAVLATFIWTGLIGSYSGFLSAENVFFILYFSHAILDNLKCHIFPKKYAMFIDQAGHFLIIAILYGLITR